MPPCPRLRTFMRKCKGQWNSSQTVKLCWTLPMSWSRLPSRKTEMDRPHQSSSRRYLGNLVLQLHHSLFLTNHSLGRILALQHHHCS
uniref:Uncharacterized protein n=1 Tax=Arundo donax TaxID=35708 RepID=A0A0A9C3J8_ARUDO